MKDQIKIAIVTILIFVSGLITGIWTQHSKTPPPPPFGHFPEFGGPMGGHEGCLPQDMRFEKRHFMPSEGMEKMRERMEKLKPQMEEFKKKFEVIKEKSKAKIIETLNAEQKAKFNDILAKRDQMIQHVRKNKPKFEKGGMFPMVEHFEFLSTIIYKPLLERMTQDLKLDEKQKKTIDGILLERRTEVLALLDSTPPPSIEVWDKKPWEHRRIEGRSEAGPDHQKFDDRREPQGERPPEGTQAPLPPPQR